MLLTSQRAVMGRLVNARVTNVLAGLATTVICALDVYLLVDMFSGWPTIRRRRGTPADPTPGMLAPQRPIRD